MPFDNFESRHFTDEETDTLQAALAALENAVSSKMANLSASERRQYGSIAEQNKLIVNKVKEYRDIQPQLAAREVDWEEFNKDFDSRATISATLVRLDNIRNGLNNARILHDWDNFQAALRDYEYAKYMNSTTAVGYETKVNDLAQFFSSKSASRDTNEDEQDPTQDPNTDTML